MFSKLQFTQIPLYKLSIFMKKERVVDIIAFLFIILFVYTAASKFLRFEYFGGVIAQTPLLEPYTGLIQWAVPLSEILVSILLATNRHRIIGLYASLILMLLFTGYIAGILKFSTRLPCACGGVIEKLGWTNHLLFNIGFTLLSILGIWLERKGRKKSSRQTTVPVLS